MIDGEPTEDPCDQLIPSAPHLSLGMPLGNPSSAESLLRPRFRLDLTIHHPGGPETPVGSPVNGASAGFDLVQVELGPLDLVRSLRRFVLDLGMLCGSSWVK